MENVEVRNLKYGNESRPAVGKVLRLEPGYRFLTQQIAAEWLLLSLHQVGDARSWSRRASSMGDDETVFLDAPYIH